MADYTTEEAAIFAAIRMRLIALAGPLLWADLIVAPNADECADAKRSAEAPQASEASA